MIRRNRLSVIITILIVFGLACSLSPQAGNNEAEIPVTGDATEFPLMEVLPTDLPLEIPPPTDTPEPIATLEPTAEPLPTEIVHLVSPIVSVSERKASGDL